MVVVAQLVRAPDCGSGGRRFETGLPPNKSLQRNLKTFFIFRRKLAFDLKIKKVFSGIARRLLLAGFLFPVR